MTETGWIILAIVNLPTYFGLGWLIFSTWENFGEAVVFWFKPNMWSFFQGEGWDDMVAEFKLGLWLFLCTGTVFAEGLVIGSVFS